MSVNVNVNRLLPELKGRVPASPKVTAAFLDEIRHACWFSCFRSWKVLERNSGTLANPDTGRRRAVAIGEHANRILDDTRRAVHPS